MAKQRNVDYVLRIVTDPKNAATAADFAQHFKDLEASARGAERAAKAASAAVRGAGSGSGARGGRGGAGGFGGGFAAASAREERIERDTNLRQAAAAFEREKRLLADRVRAHLDASRKIREAARAASSAGWQRRQAAANFGATIGEPARDNVMRDEFSRFQREQRDRAALSERAERANIAVRKEARQAMEAATGAAERYARAIVLLGVADSKTAQEALQLVARFQAVTDVVYGTAKAFEAAGKARRAFQAMDAASGAAQAVKIGGRVVGGAAMAGGGAALGGIGAGAVALGAAISAVGIGLAAALSSEAERIRRADAKFRGALERNGGAGVDLAKLQRDAALGNPIAAARLESARGFMARQNEIEERTHGREMGGWRGAFENMDARGGLGIRGGRGVVSADQLRRLAEARYRLNSANAMGGQFMQAFNDAEAGGGLMAGANAARAMEGIKEANRLRIEATRQVGEIELEIKRTQQEAAIASIRALEERKKGLAEEARAAREARMDKEEWFGAQSPADRKKILEAAEAARNNQPLTQKQEDLLERFAPQVVREGRIKRTREEDVGNNLGFFLRNDEFKAGAREKHAAENAKKAAEGALNLPGADGKQGVRVIAPNVTTSVAVKVELDKALGEKIDTIKAAIQAVDAQTAAFVQRLEGLENAARAAEVKAGQQP